MGVCCYYSEAENWGFARSRNNIVNATQSFTYLYIQVGKRSSLLFAKIKVYSYSVVFGKDFFVAVKKSCLRYIHYLA